MKKSISFYLLSFLLLVFVFETSCKKYPDGPWLSVYTKEHRVVGEWSVEYFSINGYDSTSYLQNQPLFGTYIFSKPKEGRAEFVYSSNGNKGSNPNNYYTAGGNWQFGNNKKNLIIYAQSSYPPTHFNIGPFAADRETWEIMRLKEKKMWLKCIYNGKEYFVKFNLLRNE